MRRMNLKTVSVMLFLVGIGLLAWACILGRPSARAQGPNPQPVSVGFATTSVTITEGDTFTVTVVLSQAATQTVTVQWTATISQGGLEATYTDTIQFDAGDISQAWGFTVVDDTCPQGTGTASIVLSNPSSGLSLGSNYIMTITVLDNDT